MPIRDAELYKDKIEVSLDGRQIFYLFFGGAVIVGLVFVLGVMVGRRVEARGHLDHARTTAAVDPLAALDRLESTGGTSFQSALMGNASTSDVERKIAELGKARASGEGKKPDAKIETKPEPKVETKIDAKAEAKAEVKPEAAKAEAKPATKPEPKAEVKPAAAKADAKPADADTQAKADAEDAKPKYTLQLSSFQDKQEADAFLATLKASGYQAYLTEANVSGKGTFFRVRLGTYRSMEAANIAKADFEKASKKTASIMRI